MSPYIVAAFFGDPEQGQLVTNAIIAPNSELAAAVTVREAARQTDADLLAVSVNPLTREFLTSALRALDGRMPESGKAEVKPLFIVPPAACRHGVVGPCDACMAEIIYTGPGAA